MKENLLLPLGLVLFPLLTAYVLTPSYIKQHRQNEKMTRLNFQGKRVVTTGGIILLPALFALYPYYFISSAQENSRFMYMLLYVSGVALLGAIDDIWGEERCKGFRGHFKKLCAGEGISTGLYKAAGGLLLGLLVAAFTASEYNWREWLLKAIFLALFSNFFNLLDTKPARTIKTFFLLSLLFMLFLKGPFLPLFALWSALYIYLFWELKTEVMLGDTGAYLLGGGLGFYLIQVLPQFYLLLLNLCLLFLHWYGEKHSLGRLLERKSLLCRLHGSDRRG